MLSFPFPDLPRGRSPFRGGPEKMHNISDYNPGQKGMGHSRKLGTKTHFAKLTFFFVPVKKAWGCCHKGLYLLPPCPPSSVDCVELKLEYITSTLHRGGRGEGRCLNLTSYCVSVPRVLTRVVSETPSIGKRVLNITKLREKLWICRYSNVKNVTRCYLVTIIYSEIGGA